MSWRDEACTPDPKLGTIPAFPPSRAAFLVRDDRVLLAVGFRNHAVFIWDVLELQLLGTCQSNGHNNGINDLKFSPSPEIPVLAMSDQHGNLLIFDYTTMELHHCQPNVVALSLAFSADGQALSAGRAQGLVDVYRL